MRLPQRKQSRLGCFNYSESGSYFITICTEGRRKILSEISAGAGFPDSPEVTIHLLNSGKITEKWIQEMNRHYDDISVDCYVIMPDHVYLLLSLTEKSGLSGRPATTAESRCNAAVSRFVGTLKRFTNREIGESIWQRSFYDHVIRNQQDYAQIWNYIEDNLRKWIYAHDRL